MLLNSRILDLSLFIYLFFNGRALSHLDRVKFWIGCAFMLSRLSPVDPLQPCELG